MSYVAIATRGCSPSPLMTAAVLTSLLPGPCRRKAVPPMDDRILWLLVALSAVIYTFLALYWIAWQLVNLVSW